MNKRSVRISPHVRKDRKGGLVHVGAYTQRRQPGEILYDRIRVRRGLGRTLFGTANALLAVFTKSTPRRRRAALLAVAGLSLGLGELAAWGVTRSAMACVAAGALVFLAGFKTYHKVVKPSPFAPEPNSRRRGSE